MLGLLILKKWSCKISYSYVQDLQTRKSDSHVLRMPLMLLTALPTAPKTQECAAGSKYLIQYLTVLLFWVFVVYQHECDSCWHGLNLSSMLVVLVTFWRDEYFNLYKVVDTVSCHGNNISGRLDMYENWAWFNSTRQLSMAKLIILWELGALIRIDTQMFFFWSAIHAILIKMLKWT